jgi:hypothetical protein
MGLQTDSQITKKDHNIMFAAAMIFGGILPMLGMTMTLGDNKPVPSQENCANSAPQAQAATPAPALKR